jgi:hypothetical protein
MASNPDSTASTAASACAVTIRSRSASVAALVIRKPNGENAFPGAIACDRFDAPLATGPACPIWAAAAAPSAWTASVSRRRPGTASSRSQICCRCVRPSGLTARYATVVIPTPPAACRRWKSISAGVTSASGVRPSNVAALTIRLGTVTGPSRAGANTVVGIRSAQHASDADSSSDGIGARSTVT